MQSKEKQGFESLLRSKLYKKEGLRGSEFMGVGVDVVDTPTSFKKIDEH